MDTNWVLLLAGSKYVFLGLIYLMLFVVVGAVRQEMRQHVKGAGQQSRVAPGRLKLIECGSAAQWQPGHVFTLQHETLLGADRGNTITLGDTFVSARHAHLKWDGIKWWIEDLGSTNGTFVNGQRCPPYQKQPVPIGTLLRLGDMVLQLQV